MEVAGCETGDEMGWGSVDVSVTPMFISQLKSGGKKTTYWEYVSGIPIS